MKLARHKDILAIKTARGTVVGFHAHNLQAAALDHEAWAALTNEAGADEARTELALWNAEIDPSVKDAVLPNGVRSLAINVAQLCNLKCTYCAAGGDGTFGDPMKEVDLDVIYEQIRMLLHDVPNGGEFKFTFLGGEPLLAPKALQAIHRFAKLQVAGRAIRLKFDIVTNGTLATPANAQLLANMQAHVTVSMDGPPQVNDLSRPAKNGRSSSDQTLAGIRNLVAVKPLLGSLSVGSVFGKHYTDVVETYKFFQPMPFDSLRFDFAVGDHDEEASAKYVEQLQAVADMAFAEGGEAELRRLSMFDLYFRILDGKQRIRNHCGAGKTHLHVDTRGALTTCQWFVGNKAEQVGQGTTIEHQKLEEYADPLVEKHSCQSCWARNLCGGGCMYVNKTKTGSKHKKDNEFCTRTRSLVAKGIEKYVESRYKGDPSETH